MSAVKNWLKKILPPPVNSFMREINRVVNVMEQERENVGLLLKEQEKQLDLLTVKFERQENCFIEIMQETQAKIMQLQSLLEQMNDIMIQSEKTILACEMKKSERILKHINDLQKQQLEIKNDVYVARNCAWQSQQNTKELLWADIFYGVSSNSDWLKNKSFAVGRWAVGYQYLYIVYRILNEIKPKKILELGLGQSTKLIGQYVDNNSVVMHQIVEHDKEWIQFFRKDFSLSENSSIVRLEREYRIFQEDENVLAFAGFKEQFKKQKFDFISIDAPYGGDAVIYARIDIIEIIPECLEDSFVIVFDDYNRQGEKNTVIVLEEKLKNSKIDYVKGVYSGQKDCLVICSKNLKFLSSM